MKARGAFAPAADPHAPIPQSDYAIIGAGITGLSAGYALARHSPDAQVAILDASDRPGGKVRSHRVEGPGGDYLLEVGADAFLARQKPWAYELALELGLADEIQPTDDRHSGVYVVNRGGLLRLPQGLQLILPTDWEAFAASPLLSAEGKARLAAERDVPPRTDSADESIASFVTRRLGAEALEKLGEPLLSGIYSARPEEQSLLATFPRFRQMEKTHGSLLRAVDAQRKSPQAAPRPAAPAPSAFVSFRNGTETLARTLAAAVQENLRLACPVDSLEQTGPGYQLGLASGETVNARRVLLAVPARQAARLLRTVAPPAKAVLEELRTVSSGVAYLAFRREDVPHPLDAFGVVVPRCEGRDCNALTFVSSKFAGRAPEGYTLLRYFFGGARTPHLLERDDAEIVQTARQELAHLLGIQAQPRLARVFRWWDAQPQYDVGHLQRMERLRAALPPGLHVAGTAYGGVGIPDCVRQAQEVATQKWRHK